MCRHNDRNKNDQLDGYHHRVRDVPSVRYVKKQSMKDDAKRREVVVEYQHVVCDEKKLLS